MMRHWRDYKWEWNIFDLYLIESESYWYIGFTYQGVDARMRDHLRASKTHRRQSNLHQKMQELGSDAFTVRVLVEGLVDPLTCADFWYWHFRATDPRTTLNARPPRGWKGHEDQRAELPPRSVDLPPTYNKWGQS